MAESSSAPSGATVGIASGAATPNAVPNAAVETRQPGSDEACRITAETT
jgi:hypothetical protein